MIKLIALLMTIVGALYPAPQAIRAIQRGCAKGISKWMILLWLVDKSLSLTYVSYLQDIPLMIKYGVGLIFVLIIAYFKRVD